MVPCTVLAMLYFMIVTAWAFAVIIIMKWGLLFVMMATTVIRLTILGMWIRVIGQLLPSVLTEP